MPSRSKAAGPRLRKETKLLTDARAKFSRGTSRLFRNNVGAAFVGPHYWLPDGSVVITKPTRIQYGLGVGTSDLIGWRSRIIHEADVGFRMAQFVAIEGKSPAGKATETQSAFLTTVWEHGGLAGVARSEEDFAAILAGRPYRAD